MSLPSVYSATGKHKGHTGAGTYSHPGLTDLDLVICVFFIYVSGPVKQSELYSFSVDSALIFINISTHCTVNRPASFLLAAS